MQTEETVTVRTAYIVEIFPDQEENRARPIFIPCETVTTAWLVWYRYASAHERFPPNTMVGRYIYNGVGLSAWNIHREIEEAGLRFYGGPTLLPLYRQLFQGVGSRDFLSLTPITSDELFKNIP